MLGKIKVVDDIMGKGKTEFAIQEMQKDNDYNYFYITPYLDEIKRVKSKCENRKFYEPGIEDFERVETKDNKLKDLHYLLGNNKDIISTHALFKKSNEITKELIKAGNYILILDEVMDVVRQMNLGKHDLANMLELKLIEVKDNGLIVWNKEWEDYDGKFNEVKAMSKNKSLFVIDNTTILMWTFPIEIFKCFQEVYILTYLFDGQVQKYYYDLYNIEYEYYHVEKNNDKYEIVLGKSNDDKINLIDKIHILDNKKLNNIGDENYSLSATWYDKNKDNKELLNKIKNNLNNYFRKIMKAPASTVLWTTFKDYKNIGKRYAKSFVSINIRATNNFRDRIYLAYLINRYLNPFTKRFFQQNNVSVDEEMYALSEMLQWIWRSAIREGNEIWIYVPSRRMRKLLQNWLEN